MVSDRYSRHTHVAFSDESKHNTGRYRSLGLVTRSSGMIVATVTWSQSQMHAATMCTQRKKAGSETLSTQYYRRTEISYRQRLVLTASHDAVEVECPQCVDGHLEAADGTHDSIKGRTPLSLQDSRGGSFTHRP
jgi:hypothetical protein